MNYSLFVGVRQVSVFIVAVRRDFQDTSSKNAEPRPNIHSSLPDIMKVITLLIALVTTSSALVALPPNGNTKSHLMIRADEEQTLTNPDNEPGFKDPVTGKTMEKSRILSGIGPDAAKDRSFDWDESCSDAKHRAKIAAAFGNVQQLAEHASTRLEDLKGKLPKPTTGRANKENRQFIAGADQAYTQMFKAQDQKIEEVKGGFDALTANMKNPTGRGGGNPGALRIICGWDNKVRFGSKYNYAPLCG